MSENQNYADILDKEYIGFFTESAKEDLADASSILYPSCLVRGIAEHLQKSQTKRLYLCLILFIGN